MTGSLFDFVDLFSGWGGFSIGAVSAGGRLMRAIDHNQLCVDAHAYTHPEAAHECADLTRADFSQLPDMDILLASPPCQGHSKASQPRRGAQHETLRHAAWSVVTAVGAKRPPIVVVENVLGFRRWDMLPAWAGALEALGYSLAMVRMMASDYGVPQDRDRLFVVATRGAAPVDLDVSRYKMPHCGWGATIEWQDGPWRPIAMAAPGTRRRIAAGVARLGADRFLTQHVTGHRGRAITQAFPTITKQDHLAVVSGLAYRPLTVRETARGMGFSEEWAPMPGLSRPAVLMGLGNAVCPPVAAAIMRAILAHA